MHNNKQANRPHKYDVIIIGAGAAGSTAVEILNEQGKSVALIEREALGGTCLNYGCDPTKTMLHSADLLQQARRANQYGLRIESPQVDWTALQERVRSVQNAMRGGTPSQARTAMRERGINLIMGEARFISPHVVEVNEQHLEAERFLIATGVRTAVPDVPGLQEAGYLTNKQAVSLPELPRRLAILGGGQLGIEFAQLFSRLGVEVAVFESKDRIMSGDDAELVTELRQILEEEGIRIQTNATLARVESNSAEKRLLFENGSTHMADEILVATGRSPAIDSLQLDAAGVQSNPEKGILVNDTLRTNVEHIWAGGDVVTPYRFTHIAENHGEIIAHNMYAKTPKRFEPTVIPWATYTSPTLATVGKTEEALKGEGTEYTVQRQRFTDVPRALASGRTHGQVKLLVGKAGKILGSHILAEHAGDLLAPIILAMHCGLPATSLSQAIFAYPTMVEAVGQAAKPVTRGGE